MKPPLGKVASKAWDRIAGLALDAKVLTPIDGPMLEAVALAYEDMMAAREELTREGHFYTTKNEAGLEMRRKNPAIEAAADAWRRFTAGLAAFGLSPSSRSKVTAEKELERDDVDLWLAGGREA